MNKIKKYFIIGISVLALVTVVYFLMVAYLVTGGFKDYKEYCSHYIPLIDDYQAINNRYPESLAKFSVPDYAPGYDPQNCSYEASVDNYQIIVPAGLVGLLIYSSKTKQWTVE